MKLKELESILYSTRGFVQYAIVYDSKQDVDVASGCSIDWAVKTYGEADVVRIEAFENQLIVTI